MKMLLIVAIVAVLGTAVVLSYTNNMPGEYRFSREVLVMKNRGIMIAWKADRADVDKAIAMWEDLRKK